MSKSQISMNLQMRSNRFASVEELTVTIVKEGKELNQGVAYLDDGTMIVVEDKKNGRRTKGCYCDLRIANGGGSYDFCEGQVDCREGFEEMKEFELNRENTVLLVIDIQEKLLPAVLKSRRSGKKYANFVGACEGM